METNADRVVQKETYIFIIDSIMQIQKPGCKYCPGNIRMTFSLHFVPIATEQDIHFIK